MSIGPSKTADAPSPSSRNAATTVWGLPMAAGRVIVEPFAPRTAPVAAQQIRGHPTLVEEHVLAHIAEGLPRAPRPPGRHDVRASLFVGVYRFF